MKKEMKKKIAEFAPQMYSVLKELQESASYWSEYDVPLGIVDRINDVLEKVENAQKVDTIKTTFDLNKISKKSHKSLACVDELRIF